MPANERMAAAVAILRAMGGSEPTATRSATAGAVRILPDPELVALAPTGAVESIQEAELSLPGAALEERWRPEYLERLARAYWRFLHRVSLGLVRVVYTADSRAIVLLFPWFVLLRFHAPDYEIDADSGEVTWRIRRGLLVAREGRDRGFLRIRVRRRGSDPSAPQLERVSVRVEVKNFYPWLRGRGRFARFGTWLYGTTQLRLHVLISRGFLRSLARLDLPPSRIGKLTGEIRRDG